MAFEVTDGDLARIATEAAHAPEHASAILTGALAMLLLTKGIITQPELDEAMATLRADLVTEWMGSGARREELHAAAVLARLMGR